MNEFIPEGLKANSYLLAIEVQLYQYKIMVLLSKNKGTYASRKKFETQNILNVCSAGRGYRKMTSFHEHKNGVAAVALDFGR